MPSWTPISKEKHADMRWRPRNKFGFAINEMFAEVCFSELKQLLPHYVLGILKPEGGISRLVCLLGLGGSQNLFVNEQQQWMCEVVPLDLVTHPIRLLTNTDDSSRVLCIDEEHLTDDPECAPIFTIDKEIAPELQRVLEFQLKRDQERMLTRKICDLLISKGVTEPLDFEIDVEGEEKSFKLQDVFRIDEEKLQAKANEILSEEQGFPTLEIALAQIFSENQFSQLTKRMEILGSIQIQKKAISDEIEGVLSGDNALNFDRF